jgi:hypothetical protein
MAGFVEGVDRGQSTLFPALLDDYVAEDNPVRAVDVFVEGLDLDKLGFVGVAIGQRDRGKDVQQDENADRDQGRSRHIDRQRAGHLCPHPPWLAGCPSQHGRSSDSAPRHCVPVRLGRSGRLVQFGRASAPTIPQPVQTMHGPKDTGTSSGQWSTATTAPRWQSQQLTESERNPLGQHVAKRLRKQRGARARHHGGGLDDEATN